MKKINLAIITACLTLFTTVSCSDLEENTYSELSASNFYKTELELLQANLRPFTHMQSWLSWWGQSGYFYHNTLSADQEAWPQKGRHAFDNGDHIRQHYHTWTAQENRLNDAWSGMWTGLGYVNTAIESIEAVDAASIGVAPERLASIVSEAKMLRAYHYMKIMDMWGNVPIVTTVGTPVSPETRDRKEVFAFIEKEMLENVEKLQPLSPKLIGRISKAVGYTMLSELYLNAEIWSGTARWADAIKYADKTISGEGGGLNGNIRLDQDILGPYSNTNDRSPENIFQFPYSKKNDFNYTWSGIYMGFSNMKDALDVDFAGNNAFVVIPTAFDAYKETDLRKKEWFLFGPQFKFGTTTPILGSEEYRGKPFIYVNNIRRNTEGETGEGGMTRGEENSGARMYKYRAGRLADAQYQENDFIIYRLTELYFNKAEALMRANGGKATPEAVELINTSKKRYFTAAQWETEKYTVANLTIDELLAERGREFIFEGKRRTDLIRFGKFITGTWWDHKATVDPTRTLYPIPLRQLQANPNLKQNPGYN